jgi:type IV pilus assembly protein PilA
MSASPRRRPADESGFTLVELLVVILIIGLLAAIALPAFLNQRTKAQDSQAKVYVTTAVKALGVWHTDNSTYAGADAAALRGIEASLGGARNLTVTGTATTYTVSVDSVAGSSGGGTYTISLLGTGATQRTCANAGKGSCAAAPDAQGNSW